MIDDQDILDIGEDYFLQHYGKKGMKWGERRAQNRSLNKASSKKDWAKQEKVVGKARERVKSGQSKTDLNKAKMKFKENKAKVGSREARKILNEARNKHYNELNVAQQAKSKKEAAVILGIVGGVLALSIASSVASATRKY